MNRIFPILAVAAFLLLSVPAAAWPDHPDATNMAWGEDLLQAVRVKLPAADATDAVTPIPAGADDSIDAEASPEVGEATFARAPETPGICTALCNISLEPLDNMTLCELCNKLSSNNSSIDSSKLDQSIAQLCRELADGSAYIDGGNGDLQCNESCELGRLPLKSFCNESICNESICNESIYIEALANASRRESSLEDKASSAAIVDTSPENASAVGVDIQGGFQGYWGMTASKKGIGRSGINSRTMLQGDFDIEKSVYFHE